MFYRILGRTFLYFYVLPAVHRYVWPVIIDVVTEVVNRQLENLTPEDKARLAAAKARRSARS